MDKILASLPPDSEAAAVRRAALHAAKSKVQAMVPQEPTAPVPDPNSPVAKIQPSDKGPKNRKDFRKEAALARRKKIKRKNRKGRK